MEALAWKMALRRLAIGRQSIISRRRVAVGEHRRVHVAIGLERGNPAIGVMIERRAGSQAPVFVWLIQARER